MINTEHFTVLAGNVSAHDNETRKLTSEGVDLVKVQENQHAAGVRHAELVESVYGFGVRSGSGLDGFAILFGRNDAKWDGKYETALAWGKKWAEEDPNNREFYIRNSLLKKIADAPKPDESRPRIGDIFEKEGSRYRIACFLQAIKHPNPEKAVVHLDKQGRYYKFSSRQDATHVEGVGVCGTMVPIEGIKVVGRVDWPEKQIKEAEASAQRLIGEVVF